MDSQDAAFLGENPSIICCRRDHKSFAYTEDLKIIKIAEGQNQKGGKTPERLPKMMALV